MRSSRFVRAEPKSHRFLIHPSIDYETVESTTVTEHEHLTTAQPEPQTLHPTNTRALLSASAIVAFTSFFPPIASAQDIVLSTTSTLISENSVLLSAIVAYGHYLAFGIAAATLAVERLTIQTNMSPQQEERMVFADILYGISALTIVVTGYFRVTDFGKGWDFYSHEPIFWLKMSAFMIVGAASFFPTLILIQRAIHIAQWKKTNEMQDTFQPMSDALVKRMTTLINAELLAFTTIPLFATTMSRGIGYVEMENIPVNIVGPIVTAVVGLGLGLKYVKEALSWPNEDKIQRS